MGLLALRPGDSLTILEDGFVNRLQNGKFPLHPAIQATGLGLLPRWDSHPLVMPAFAGRTLPVPYLWSMNALVTKYKSTRLSYPDCFHLPKRQSSSRLIVQSRHEVRGGRLV